MAACRHIIALYLFNAAAKEAGVPPAETVRLTRISQ